MMAWYFRALGAKIGKDCCLYPGTFFETFSTVYLAEVEKWTQFFSFLLHSFLFFSF